MSVTAAIDQYFDASDRWHSHHHWLHHLIDPRATWCDIRCDIVHDFQPQREYAHYFSRQSRAKSAFRDELDPFRFVPMTIVTPDQFTAPRRDEKPAAWCDFGRDRQMAVTHAVLRRDNTRAVAIFSSETDLACSLDHLGQVI